VYGFDRRCGSGNGMSVVPRLTCVIQVGRWAIPIAEVVGSVPAIASQWAGSFVVEHDTENAGCGTL
jgi:hypothetical protein